MSGRLEGSVEQHVHSLLASLARLESRVAELEKHVQELKMPVVVPEVMHAEVKPVGKGKK